MTRIRVLSLVMSEKYVNVSRVSKVPVLGGNTRL